MGDISIALSKFATDVVFIYKTRDNKGIANLNIYSVANRDMRNPDGSIKASLSYESGGTQVLSDPNLKPGDFAEGSINRGAAGAIAYNLAKPGNQDIVFFYNPEEKGTASLSYWDDTNNKPITSTDVPGIQNRTDEGKPGESISFPDGSSDVTKIEQSGYTLGNITKDGNVVSIDYPNNFGKLTDGCQHFIVHFTKTPAKQDGTATLKCYDDDTNTYITIENVPSIQNRTDNGKVDDAISFADGQNDVTKIENANYEIVNTTKGNENGPSLGNGYVVNGNLTPTPQNFVVHFKHRKQTAQYMAKSTLTVNYSNDDSSAPQITKPSNDSQIINFTRDVTTDLVTGNKTTGNRTQANSSFESVITPNQDGWTVKSVKDANTGVSDNDSIGNVKILPAERNANNVVNVVYTPVEKPAPQQQKATVKIVDKTDNKQLGDAFNSQGLTDESITFPDEPQPVLPENTPNEPENVTPHGQDVPDVPEENTDNVRPHSSATLQKEESVRPHSVTPENVSDKQIASAKKVVSRNELPQTGEDGGLNELAAALGLAASSIGLLGLTGAKKRRKNR